MQLSSISPFRLHALAGYNLQPDISVTDEGPCLSINDDQVLGLCYQHPITKMFGGIVLHRDDSQRYQIVQINAYVADPEETEKQVAAEMKRRAALPTPKSYERTAPLDLFTRVVSEERLNPYFRELLQHRRFSPARDLITRLMTHYKDPDGIFVEQFQTTGFDPRLWELYVYAVFAEDGFVIDRTYQRPDFLVKSKALELFVEAVTTNPTLDEGINIEMGLPDDNAELSLYLQNYVPIKYGQPLRKKLKKKYWELAHVAGKPIVLAIQDFHAQGSMSYTASVISDYLYGLDHVPQVDATGQLCIIAKKIEEHIWGDRTIKSGFFNQAGAEYISAVITNGNATINKFNRIGYIAGFGDRDIKMIRAGTCIDHDPNATKPKVFSLEVDAPDYIEPWGEGMNIYHNPKALHPVTSDILRFGAHHRLVGDQIASSSPDFHPIASKTAYATKKRTAGVKR